LIDRIAELMKHETAGDPITGLKWTHKTTAKIAKELQAGGIDVSPRTVARLLDNMGYSLRVNHKKLSRVSKTSPESRNAQFEHIAGLREKFARLGLPVISVDTKKKELIGRFKNSGAAWSQEPVRVKDHDFPSEADGKAIPYGIYDVGANLGTVMVGTTHETAQFAVDAIEMWWLEEGSVRYPNVKELLILADGGGANAATNRAWKHGIYHQLARRHGLTVTVAHYPPGASKWNPIEHRLFSEISKNWAGRPLDTFETVLNHIRSTTTKTGLRVTAHLVTRQYAPGVKITDAEMRELAVTKHASLPRWNYTVAPDPTLKLSAPTPPPAQSPSARGGRPDEARRDRRPRRRTREEAALTASPT
jgi:hypothetical protein